jgi:hypothetical protein
MNNDRATLPMSSIICCESLKIFGVIEIADDGCYNIADIGRSKSTPTTICSQPPSHIAPE